MGRHLDQNGPPRIRAMGQAGRTVALAVALSAIAFIAKAQDGDIAAGHAFARAACKACHIVEAEEDSSRMIVIGPAFRNIANTPGMTATALRVFLTSSHPNMPNLILTPEEIADVTAYILSLRDHR
jgi:mono/diheme cytochrome c family protein